MSRTLSASDAMYNPVALPWATSPVQRQKQTSLHLGAVCGLLGLNAAVCTSAFWLYLHVPNFFGGHAGGLRVQNELLQRDTERYDKKTRFYREDNRWLEKANARLKERLAEAPFKNAHPYEAITGNVRGHEPEMHGKVPEKTIWSYWYDPVTCPNSWNCRLPDYLQLCVDTVEKNKGSFEHKLLRKDDVDRYVNLYELPFKWPAFSPQHMKDSLMNALLARYGGVALDVSTILLRPLDDYWEEMVAKRATFRGYMYRLNGMPWRHPEVSAVWFLMSRREGLFATAIRKQVEGMGDNSTPRKLYRQSYLAFGDQTLLPILSMLNYSLPRCDTDTTVEGAGRVCPELEGPPWAKGLTGPPRNDVRVLLRDPRDGPQLPYVTLGASMWNISNSTRGIPHGSLRFGDPSLRGGPMYRESCSSFRECWESVFLRRYNAAPVPGEARLLSFVKFFSHGAELEGKSRRELLANKDSYLYNWLKLAGLDSLD